MAEPEPYLQREAIPIPSVAIWFDINVIHEIERDSLPEFFNGRFPAKTPKVYKEQRNFIIKLYRENPNFYLSASDCRKYLPGDVCSVLRIHCFLEHWGLINLNGEPFQIPTLKDYERMIIHRLNGEQPEEEST
jgi:SWI/SNF related-matrix-associated actin-dependent regulator of chromatin subfamily C